jgi:hypothetical protein
MKNELLLRETLDALVPPVNETADWDDVLERAAAPARSRHPALRRHRLLNTRGTSLAFAAALAVAAAIALILAAPWESGPGSVAPAEAALALGRVPGHAIAGPYVGVDCPHTLNSIACDRLGIAVQLLRPAVALDVTIAGRRVTMHATNFYTPHARKRTFWVGFLYPAGLLDGPLKIHPDEGRYYWVGRHPAFATVKITAHYNDGSSATATRRTRIGAGWG